MRTRDIASITTIAILTILVGLYGWSAAETMLLTAADVNRDDARCVSATLLPSSDWVEFPVLRDATNLRLLTNAALQSVDAPDHDLTNPRDGWRYAVQYELVSADGNIVKKSEYHFRSQVRQLVDADNGKTIYPIFLGENGLVSAQTRAMQLAVSRYDSRPVRFRLRLLSADSAIRDIVVRLLSRMERDDYDKRFTWNRLSKQRRELICQHCVYEPNLLSASERTNLLRWRWARTAPLTNPFNRFLYFIGDADDLEVRDEQLPAGLLTDVNWLATIPVPAGKGRTRLNFQIVDPLSEPPTAVAVRWFGAGVQQRDERFHRLVTPTSSLEVETDGGLIQIQSPTRVVVQAFWESTGDQAAWFHTDGELEITPVPILIKTYVVDSQPLEYSVSHHGNHATPFRLSLRYPFGRHFANPTIQSFDDPVLRALKDIETKWEFLDDHGNVVESGILSFKPQPSRYDYVELLGKNEWLSEPMHYFFAVPAHVRRVRLLMPGGRILTAASVRPARLSYETQIPEDSHPFHARNSTRRSWFGLNPIDEQDLIQANRSFIIRAQTRPPTDNEDILAGNYQWHRFRPTGRWIGRQMLVPQDQQLAVREQAIAATFFELPNGVPMSFSSFDSVSPARQSSATLIVIADDAPGKVTVAINDQVVATRLAHSARGEIDLQNVVLPPSGHITVDSELPARFFLRSRRVDDGERFLKRTAQRLTGGQLEFSYVKQTDDEELLTIQIYRPLGDHQRCRLRVQIDAANSASETPIAPRESFTLTDRTYDLRSQTGSNSLLLGSVERVDVGHRCFIRLGNDLAAGVYKIKVKQIDDQNDAYVLLYQSRPGIQPLRDLNVQRVYQQREDKNTKGAHPYEH